MRPVARRERSSRGFTPPEERSRALAIRFTSRSIRAPSGFSNWRTNAGSAAQNVALARAFREAVHEAWGKPLTMNVAMPIAAVMLDLGFPAASVKTVPLLARTAGLLAHLAEEQQQPLGFLMAGKAEEAIEYERGR